MATKSRLFQPLKVGDMELKHRVAMAPLTRYRATDDHVPNDLMVEQYSQRAVVPGTLLISEAIDISVKQGGSNNTPGIYNEAQVEAWKKITEVVHAKHSFIVAQLNGHGRAATEEVAAREGFSIKSSSTIPFSGGAVPRAMTTEEVKSTIQDFADAARNAIRAGFDAVELHGAHGRLIDQFVQSSANQRTDEYGGSIENRSRFAIEVVESVINAIGAERTAIRLSPWSRFQDMRTSDPIPQFTDLIQKLPTNLAYLHVTEPRVNANEDAVGGVTGSNDFIHKLWSGTYFAAGGFTPENVGHYIDELWPNKDVVIVFGRSFIANPDLPFRLREGIPLNPWNRSGFYVPKAAVGYVDQPYSKEFEALQGLPN
ncbi:NADH:flavin oxidoreductase/NADH oxidase [Thozetella sp. PMI_491]|nr:NADH:flavin oxidoreductase/NADH oxidase [Thozetella sp. PMI_491]